MVLRTSIVTQDDPFYMPLFFQSFFENIPDTVVIDEITILNPFDENSLELLKRMYRLYGPLNLLKKTIEYSRRKAADRLGVRHYSVSAVANRYDIQVTPRRSVNTNGFVESLEKQNIDVLLSASAPEIFGPKVLQAPSWGCINVHTSKLPKYRGMLPTFWAMYHNEDDVGVSVHSMEEEIDRGNLLHQSLFRIRDSDTLDSVIKRGKRKGGKAAANVLQKIENENISEMPMEGEGSYFSFPTVEQRREFQRRGNQLL